MSTKDRTLRGKVAIAGIGETKYYKHGQAPESEFALALHAIVNACADAGIDPRQIDGFASYSNDRNDPSRIAAALGLPALRVKGIYLAIATLAFGFIVEEVFARWESVTGGNSGRSVPGVSLFGFQVGSGEGFYYVCLAVCALATLGVLNLLPVPVLDGGQVVFQVAELAKGAPLSMKAQVLGQKVGIAMLVVLMGFAFYNDISRLFG